MAAPIVVGKASNPVLDAIKYAGDAVRQSIGLMNQRQQLDLLKEQNQIDAGKALLQAQYNVYNGLAEELGPVDAWSKVAPGYTSALKMLGMDEQNIADFSQSMASGAVSPKDLHTQTINDLMTGRIGTLSDQRAGTYAEMEKTAQAEQAKAAESGTPETTKEARGSGTFEKPATPAPAPSIRGAVSTELTDLQSLKVHISKLLEKGGPDSPYGAETDSLIQTAIKQALANSTGKEKAMIQSWLGADQLPGFKQDVLTGRWKMEPTVGQGPEILPSPTAIQTTPEKVTLSGPLAGEVDTPEKKTAWIGSTAAAYVKAGTPEPIAQAMATFAAGIPSVQTKVPGKPAPAASTEREGWDVIAGRPMNLPSSPPANFSQEVKPYVAPPEVDDKVAYGAFKNYYEWWSKTVVGIDMTKGADRRLSPALSAYVNSLPKLADRITPEMSQRFLRSFSPTGDLAEGLQRFNASSQTALMQAEAMTAQEKRLGEKRLTWTLKAPGFEDKVGQKFNVGDYAVLVEQLNVELDAQVAAAGQDSTDMAFVLETYNKQMEFLQAIETEWQKQAAKDPKTAFSVYNDLQAAALKSSGSAYRQAYDYITSVRESLLPGFKAMTEQVTMQAGGLGWPLRWASPGRPVTSVSQPTIGTGVTPNTGGATTGAAPSPDQAAVDKYVTKAKGE